MGGIGNVFKLCQTGFWLSALCTQLCIFIDHILGTHERESLCTVVASVSIVYTLSVFCLSL